MMQSRVQLSTVWCRDAVVQVLFLVVTVPGLLAGYAQFATVGDSGEFLDVHVDPLARALLLVADGLGSSHREPGDLIEVVQQRHPGAGQNAPERRARDGEVIPDPMRPPTSGESQRHDPSFPTHR